MEDNISEFEHIEPSVARMVWTLINIGLGGLLILVGLIVLVLEAFNMTNLGEAWSSLIGLLACLGVCQFFMGICMAAPRFRRRD